MSRRESMRMSLNPDVVTERKAPSAEETSRLAATVSSDRSAVPQAWAAISLEDFCEEPIEGSMQEIA